MSETRTAGDGVHDEWIMREDQLECLVSATRTDIVDHLAAHGPMSVKELAVAIGMQPSALYHHIDKLLEVGLVVEQGSRVANRKQEKLYATLSRRIRLRRALEEGQHKDIMNRIVATLGRRAERDFARGQEHASACADGNARNLGFFRLVARPNAEKLARINALLGEVAELMWEDADPDGDVVALTWVMAPVG